MRKLAVFGVLLGILCTAHHEFEVAAAAPAWTNATGNLATMASECGNLTLVSAMPGSNAVLAGVAHKGLWSNSSGTTWTQMGTGAGSDTIINRPSWISYDPSDSRIFWESGIYNGGGIYKTVDGGNTFHQLGAISHNDYVSVDFTDPNRRTLIAGGHEQSQTVYLSTNGGTSWTNAGSTIPPNTKFTTYPLLLNAQTFVVSAYGWATGTSGVFRTTNQGGSWQQVSTQGPSLPPLLASNGTIYWSNGGNLLKSTDAGVSWTQVGSNLQNITPIELPDHTLASVSWSNTIVISADGGSTWSPLGPPLPYSPAGLAYSAQRNAFFIWHWDCGTVVLPDAIMKLDWAFSALAAPRNFHVIAENSAPAASTTRSRIIDRSF